MEFEALTQRWSAAEERKDRRAAATPTLLANLHRKKGQPAFKLADFMPHRPQRPRRRQSQEEQIAIMRQLAAYMGGSGPGRGG